MCLCLSSRKDLILQFLICCEVWHILKDSKMTNYIYQKAGFNKC